MQRGRRGWHMIGWRGAWSSQRVEELKSQTNSEDVVRRVKWDSEASRIIRQSLLVFSFLSFFCAEGTQDAEKKGGSRFAYVP